MYDPSIGRWLEEDPIGFEAGDTNLYRYVFNDPTNLTDPSGLQVQKSKPTELQLFYASVIQLGLSGLMPAPLKLYDLRKYQYAKPFDPSSAPSGSRHSGG